MPTFLSIDDHLAGLARSGALLADAAAVAGLRAGVPTCPGWDVASLVTHQGMIHRWAAANLRGEADHDTDESVAAATAAPDLVAWYSDGLAALLDTIRATPHDAQATVFLRDAPPPLRFWARRQCHETTIHAVDAVAAGLRGWPCAADVQIDPLLAADGVDELLMGFVTRGQGRLHGDEPYTITVRTLDTGHAWTLRISDGPVVTTVGESGQPGVVFAGTAVQLYLTLWNRADDITVDGPSDALDEWRATIRPRWG